MRAQILEAFNKLLDPTHSDSQVWVTEYEAPPEADVHQCVLFLRPEVSLPAQGALPGVLDVTLATLKEWDIDIGAVRILRGDYLEKHRIMDQHYGVLNAISKQGIAAISPSAREKLEVEFAEQIETGAQVLGGHQFLEAQPAFSALSLMAISENLGSCKLGGGTYASYLKVLAEKYILLNAFHAYQLEPFCQKDNAIVVLDCRSKKPWADLRSKLAGATNPEVAEVGSIRNQFLLQQASLGLGDVSQGSNGVHLSAGPLEGMVEARRFFSSHESGSEMPWTNFAFANLLSQSGLDEGQINALTENPLLSTSGGE